MVALGAGRLQPRKLISLWNLEELRFIEVSGDAITIGAGSTFTDIRNHPVIAEEFPLLTQAASWTGSIANQNRATIGGNIVNASPAADTPPALLAYDAELTIVSSSDERTLPYRDFHLSYKKTALAPNELLQSITILRNFEGYKTYIRKVGTRNAQAISKLAIAALARTNKTHQRHKNRRRQPARSPHPPPTHGTIPPQQTHHPRNHRRRPRRPHQRIRTHRRHPQHRQIPHRHRRQPPRRIPPHPLKPVAVYLRFCPCFYSLLMTRCSFSLLLSLSLTSVSALL